MKKKELLIILILTVIVTILSLFLKGGVPFKFYAVLPGPGGMEIAFTKIFNHLFVLDFLFWFLVLTGIWWVYKKVK